LVWTGAFPCAAGGSARAPDSASAAVRVVVLLVCAGRAADRLARWADASTHAAGLTHRAGMAARPAVGVVALRVDADAVARDLTRGTRALAVQARRADGA